MAAVIDLATAAAVVVVLVAAMVHWIHWWLTWWAVWVVISTTLTDDLQLHHAMPVTPVLLVEMNSIIVTMWSITITRYGYIQWSPLCAPFCSFSSFSLVSMKISHTLLSPYSTITRHASIAKCAVLLLIVLDPVTNTMANFIANAIIMWSRNESYALDGIYIFIFFSAKVIMWLKVKEYLQRPTYHLQCECHQGHGQILSSWSCKMLPLLWTTGRKDRIQGTSRSFVLSFWFQELIPTHVPCL